MAIIGIDIGGTTTKGVLIGADNHSVLATASLATIVNPDGVIAGVVQLVKLLCNEANVDSAKIKAVGIGIPGIVDFEAGTVANTANLGFGEQPFPLAERLSAELGVPVYVDNDLNVAALGAASIFHDDAVFHDDTAPKPIDLAFLSLGTGVAAGYVLDGELRRGHSLTGEIGHVPIDPHGLPCPCGQRGCLERYCSGSALEQLWPAQGDQPGPQALFRQAQAGNPQAIKIRDAYCDAVAIAIRNLVLSLGPRLVVIGGGVVRLEGLLWDGIVAALKRLAAPSRLLQSLDLPSRVALAPAAAPVGSLGAAVLAAQQISL